MPRVRAVGIATTYWRNDGYNHGRLGCVREARRLLGHRELRDELPIIATRAGRCGQRIVVENVGTGARTVALRLDAGPWGQACPDGWRAAVHLGPGCRWRGVADLTRRVAREIGATGWTRVRLRW